MGARGEIRLDGKVVLVTGASGGWGSGAATALAARGATVVLSARTQANLDLLAGRIRDQGGEAIGVAADLSTPDQATALVAAVIQRCGRIDVLVNSTGAPVTEIAADPGDGTGRPYLGQSILEMSIETWRQVIDLELTGVFACTKAAAAQMAALGEGGSIVTLAGGAGIYGMPGSGARAAAKGGVTSAMWTWSDELAPLGIRVNVIRGFVHSGITDPSWSLADPGATSPSRTGFDAASAAPLVVWLASDEAHDITGTYVGIDGARITLWEPKAPDLAVFRDQGWTPEELARSLGPIIRNRPPRARLHVLTDGVDAALPQGGSAGS